MEGTTERTIITLNSNLTEKETAKVIAEIERELMELGAPRWKRAGNIVTVEKAISQEARTRIYMIPRVREVVTKANSA